MSVIEIGVVALVILAAVFLIRRLKKTPPQTADSIPNPDDAFRAPPESQSSLGTCKKCGQERVIVNKDLGYCAFCWSSQHTKPLG